MDFLRWLTDTYSLIMSWLIFFPIRYYGCPNSKKANRLQLKKRLFR